MEMVMETETTKESGMDYLTTMVDEYGSEMALMTGRLTFGRIFFLECWNNGVMDYLSYGALE